MTDKSHRWRRPSSNLTLIPAFSSQVAHLTGSRFHLSLSHFFPNNINLNLNDAPNIWAFAVPKSKTRQPRLVENATPQTCEMPFTLSVWRSCERLLLLFVQAEGHPGQGRAPNTSEQQVLLSSIVNTFPGERTPHMLLLY